MSCTYIHYYWYQLSCPSNINIELQFNQHSKILIMIFLSTSLWIHLRCSSSIFLGDLPGFSCCLQQILRMSCFGQKRSCFFFQTWKFACLYIWEAYGILITVRIVRINFLSICSYLEMLVPYAPLHCWHPYQSRNHLMDSCLHLSFQSRIPNYRYVKSHILWCFQNQQFCQ